MWVCIFVLVWFCPFVFLFSFFLFFAFLFFCLFACFVLFLLFVMYYFFCLFSSFLFFISCFVFILLFLFLFICCCCCWWCHCCLCFVCICFVFLVLAFLLLFCFGLFLTFCLFNNIKKLKSIFQKRKWKCLQKMLPPQFETFQLKILTHEKIENIFSEFISFRKIRWNRTYERICFTLFRCFEMLSLAALIIDKLLGHNCNKKNYLLQHWRKWSQVIFASFSPKTKTIAKYFSIFTIDLR